MPLQVTDYTWTQTESTVHIWIPLKGARPADVHVLSSDEYVKVSFPPYLFEVFLPEPVDDDRSSVKVRNGAAVFTLLKRSTNMWDNLTNTSNDKEHQREVRNEALLKQQMNLSAESKQKAERQRADSRYALESMMTLEKEEQDTIQKMKDAERSKMEAELATWQLEENQNKLRAASKQPESRTKPVHSNTKTRTPPAPRTPGNIQVTFTPRVFPTALRESQVAEEEEWLMKQAEARRAGSSGVQNLTELKDLVEDERNPNWLKDKGDKCFSIGDYLGAMNAYSLGIHLNSKIPALYSNRAACHLRLRNFYKAIKDCSQALDLLTPPVPANSAARLRASVRRGTAFCELQLYSEAIQDYEYALKIHQNKELQQDAQRIRDIIQSLKDQEKH